MVKSLRPSSLSRTLALVPPAVALLAPQADADIFLKVEKSGGATIPGESTVQSHPSWIEAASIQFGIGNSVSIGTKGIIAGIASGSEITITKSLDRSSPLLFLACAQGTIHPKVTLEMTTYSGGMNAEIVYYRITLLNVVITGLSSSSGGDRPSESVSMGYEQITTDYFLMDQFGKIPMSPTSTATWNFATNSGK